MPRFSPDDFVALKADQGRETTSGCRPMRPALPAERICSIRDRRPLKMLVRPFQRALVWLHESGMVTRVPLRLHLVMCGFPRSGTTLCQLMAQSCVPGLRHFPAEVRALHAARYAPRNHEIMLTKRPRDLFQIEEIREHYRTRRASVRFVLFHRDPRAVLTSVHADRPGEYYIDVERWRAIHEHWKWARQWDDTVSIGFEELTLAPQYVQEQLTDLAGWKVTTPFTEVCSVAQQNFDMAALNGLRAPDPANNDRWRRPEYAERIRQLLWEMPELPQRVIEMGYERDTRWTEAYCLAAVSRSARPALTRAAAASRKHRRGIRTRAVPRTVLLARRRPRFACS